MEKQLKLTADEELLGFCYALRNAMTVMTDRKLHVRLMNRLRDVIVRLEDRKVGSTTYNRGKKASV